MSNGVSVSLCSRAASPVDTVVGDEEDTQDAPEPWYEAIQFRMTPEHKPLGLSNVEVYYENEFFMLELLSYNANTAEMVVGIPFEPTSTAPYKAAFFISQGTESEINRFKNHAHVVRAFAKICIRPHSDAAHMYMSPTDGDAVHCLTLNSTAHLFTKCNAKMCAHGAWYLGMVLLHKTT